MNFECLQRCLQHPVSVRQQRNYVDIFSLHSPRHLTGGMKWGRRSHIEGENNGRKQQQLHGEASSLLRESEIGKNGHGRGASLYRKLPECTRRSFRYQITLTPSWIKHVEQLKRAVLRSSNLHFEGSRHCSRHSLKYTLAYLKVKKG